MTEDLVRQLMEYDSWLEDQAETEYNDALNKAAYLKHRRELHQHFAGLKPITENYQDELSVRVRNHLEHGGFRRIYDLTQFTEKELVEVTKKGSNRLAKHSINEIRDKLLIPHGLDFKQES